jgi:hypothetical protein
MDSPVAYLMSSLGSAAASPRVCVMEFLTNQHSESILESETHSPVGDTYEY